MSNSSSSRFEFSCPSCLRPIKASSKASGKTLPCPGCGKEITVPTPKKSPWDAVHEPPSQDEYGVAAPVERQAFTPAIIPGIDNTYESDLDVDTYRESEASYDPESGTKSRLYDDDKLAMAERPKLPPHPMTTGIFTMFRDPSAITWLITLTLGIAIIVGCLTMSLGALVTQGFSGLTVIGLICSGIGGLLGLIVFYFATNCFLCIVQDSAAGNDIIESWPDKAGGGFSGAGFSFTFAALFYSNGIGLILAWPLRNQGLDWFPILLIVCFFTFPFFLVSVLEAGSPVAPISVNIIRSLFARFSTWVAFYIESAVIWAIGLGITFLLVQLVGDKPKVFSITCALVLGPLFTFLLFIYFRLMGRLVWVCDDWFRSLEPDEEDEEEEERDQNEIAYYDDEV